MPDYDIRGSAEGDLTSEIAAILKAKRKPSGADAVAEWIDLAAEIGAQGDAEICAMVSYCLKNGGTSVELKYARHYEQSAKNWRDEKNYRKRKNIA